MNNLFYLSIQKCFKKYPWLLVALIITVLLTVLFSLLPPQLMRILIDEHLTMKQTNGIIEIAILYLTCIFIIAITDFIKNTLLAFLGVKMSLECRYAMFLKLERIDSKYFSKNSAAEITSRFMNDVNSLHELFSDGLISLLIDCLKIIGILISIYLFSWKLSLLTLILIPIIYFITQFFRKNMLKAQRSNLYQITQVNQQLNETIQNIKMIKLFNKETYMEQNYRKCLVDNFKVKEKVNSYDSFYAPLVQMIKYLVIGIIVLLSASQFNLIGLSIGMLAASIDYLSNLFNPIESLGMEINKIQKGISGIQKLNEFFDELEETPKDEKLIHDFILKNGVQDISFNHVFFEYTKEHKVLKDISFNIQGGNNITFTGVTGVGKTTLFKLIMGLYPPTQGTVTLNSYPIISIPNREKKKIFGYVEQNFSFIRGTIFDQISLNDPDITFQQVKDACIKVELDEVIMNFEQGYDTEIKTSNEFSQGQKQLLCIARALVNDPPILLLDEITANLDSVTEERILKVLKEAIKGKTILSISHRLSFILEHEKQFHLDKGHLI